MNSSPENKWKVGGILREIQWKGDSGHVLCWDGVTRTVHDGDVVLAFLRGEQTVTFADVVPAGVEWNAS